ncbi:12072_t:CDS:2, partial [Gigaspora margarita]
RTELENLLSQANQDREIVIECGNRLANKCSVLDKDNKHIQRNLKQSNKDKEKLSKYAYQLIEEIKRLSSELDNELASKINEIEYLSALCLASQKTKDILDPVVMGGVEKNTQSEEQSFISNSGDTTESKSLAKYFKSKKKMEAEINDTSLTNRESLTNDISNIKNETLPIITNKQDSESLIQDITIERATHFNSI